VKEPFEPPEGPRERFDRVGLILPAVTISNGGRLESRYRTAAVEYLERAFT